MQLYIGVHTGRALVRPKFLFRFLKYLITIYSILNSRRTNKDLIKICSNHMFKSGCIILLFNLYCFYSFFPHNNNHYYTRISIYYKNLYETLFYKFIVML